MKRVLFVPVVLALLLGACDNFFFSDPDDVFLRIDQTEYAAGDTVELRLVNESGEPIGYDLCLDIQRDDDGTWTDTDYYDGELCPARLETLSDGQSAVFERLLPADIAPDSYRFRTTFRFDDDEHTVASRRFEVGTQEQGSP